MRWLRAVVAVMAGFGFMMFAGVVAIGLSTLVAKLMVGALGALLGGWMAARLATFAPFNHAVVLAAIVAAVSISLMRSAAQAGWYSIAAGVVGVLGVLAGGWIRSAADQARGTVDVGRPS